MAPKVSRLARHLAVCLPLLLAACGPAPTTTPSYSPIAPSSTARASESSSEAAAPTVAATAGPPHALGVVGSLKVGVVTGGLTSPVDVADPGNGSGRLFVVEQRGRIRTIDQNRLTDQPFLDISSEVKSGGEQGLLGLAFHPNFPTDPRFFVDYTDLDGDTVISEFRVNRADADVADAGSERRLLDIDQPFANHNGGGVVFGPDGKLYIAMGDGGSGGDPQGNGQRTDTLLAKILRIDIDSSDGTQRPYGIPADNPFVGVTGASPEIWLTGLRNPWRIRFDRATGDLWIGDVGQAAWEEIDVARAGVGGLNFGWNVMEGFHCFAPSEGCDRTGLTLPVAEYGHDLGCAVIGGVVVRDAGQPSFDGWYVFSDSCSGNLWLLDPAGEGRREPALLGHWPGSISSIVQAEDGRVLATDLQSGRLVAISAFAR